MTSALRFLTSVLAGMAMHAPGWSALPAPPSAGAAPERLADELARGFYSRVNVLAFGLFQDVKSSPLNPDNLLELPRYQLVLNPRVDLDLVYRRWEVSLKPRAELVREYWEDGRRDGDERTRSEFFINEGFVRFRPVDALSLSVGRENLQWGPSVIVSSSNPFNRDNGRNNPRVEVPGLDYARAVWIPDASWALSAIANTGAGRQDDTDGFAAAALPEMADDMDGSGRSSRFQKTWALKLDYTGQASYLSLIPSWRRHDQYRLGFFGGWNASDALLLYAEGVLAEDDGPQVQLGGAYTLRAGPTIQLEYFHNDDGCVGKSIAACFHDGEIDTRDVLFRRDYVMVQYTDTTLIRNLNLSLRLLRNFDDRSNRLTGILEYELGDHVQLYLIANAFTGSTRTEFGSLLRRSVFLGVGYTF